MTKKTKSALNILSEATGLYFSNFDKFTQYMTFPVLGQILGLLVILGTVFVYTKNLPYLIEKFSIFNDFYALIIVSILLTLPGLIIFVKAFWEYLVAYGAINSMYENMSKSGRVYDFRAHTELIKRRTFSFVCLWFLFSIFSFLAIFPPFWIIAGVFAIYFVLVFQVFTFEPDLSPIGCVKRSFLLIKGHFAKTFILFLMTGIVTYIFIPQIFVKLFEISGIADFVSNLINPFISQLPLIDLSKFNIVISEKDIAISSIQIILSQILIQYTLPLRSILWSLWYNERKSGFAQTNKNQTKRSSKRPSEKLMEASHKKHTKKLDKNILKRAAEKDDEE